MTLLPHHFHHHYSKSTPHLPFEFAEPVGILGGQLIGGDEDMEMDIKP